MKFRLQSGGHREGKKLYKPGDIVESDRDLAKAFKNKFEPVSPDTKAEEQAPKAASVKAPPEKNPAPRRRIDRKKTDIQV